MTIQVEILQFLHYHPSSSRVEIAAGLKNAPNERTLKRIIADCVQNGDIIVEGKAKATRYSLSAQAHLMMPLEKPSFGRSGPKSHPGKKKRIIPVRQTRRIFLPFPFHAYFIILIPITSKTWQLLQYIL